MILVFSVVLTSCADMREYLTSEDIDEISVTAPETSFSPDTGKPLIRINEDEKVVVIKKGGTVDLMSGVSGIDRRDGDITEKIRVDDGGLDTQVPGEYTVTYSLSDNAGNEADVVSRIVIVRETDVLKAPELWEETIPGEKPAPKAPGIFGGAWYHKVVSSKDKWCGMEATVTLPEVSILRYEGDFDSTLNADPDAKNLDNPSVYFGGNAGSESDVGLSFSRALVDVDNQILSTGCIAFRPFWRYITSEDQDVGGYETHNGEYAVSANGNNCIANYHWRYTEYYYLPGDTLRCIIYIPEPGKMQLQIEVISKSTLPSSVETREKYGWKDPENFLSPVFAAPGHGTGVDAEYKRVNAIDQVGNEGATAISTETRVTNAVWHETFLYREIEGKVYRVPMNSDRSAFTNAPVDSAFSISTEGATSELGGEKVDIHPATVGQ